RAQAITRMRRALDEYFVGGIKTNLGLFRRVLREPAFQRAEFDTGSLDRWLSAGAAAAEAIHADKDAMIAALAAAVFASRNGMARNGARNGKTQPAAEAKASPWKTAARTEALRDF